MAGRNREVKRRLQEEEEGGAARARGDVDVQLELAGCRVTAVPRAGSGRLDLRVVSADGRTFRSKVAALRHVDALAARRPAIELLRLRGGGDTEGEARATTRGDAQRPQRGRAVLRHREVEPACGAAVPD